MRNVSQSDGLVNKTLLDKANSITQVIALEYQLLVTVDEGEMENRTLNNFLQLIVPSDHGGNLSLCI